MYPEIERPKVIPEEILRLHPEFRNDKVFYKCLYLYRKHKKQGQDARVLSEGAFK